MKMGKPVASSGYHVTAVLGSTNTGKTHLAIERMLAHESGVIGLPLRLLAREVYDRVCARVGRENVSLITGEEKVIATGAPYAICTVEAMGRDTKAAFVAIDEVQLAADFERGHIFTDRILHLRGSRETVLLGAATMRPLLERLLPDLVLQSRPRLSRLAYVGARKITRLPRRSCIVAFSVDEVYAIAELVRRQRGGAAVVLGALSPRSRNAQVALYQSGDVDFLVATDAIGMGLNLDVDHVAFAQTRKFDGYQHRDLNAAELGQVAGRAGRYLRDGTFGVTGRVTAFEPDLVKRLEEHQFAPVKVLQWRGIDFDFSSIEALKRSLEQSPPREGLTRALPATDVRALDYLTRDEEILRLAEGEAALRLLWDVCALPDYRKIAPAQHGDMIARLYRDLRERGSLDENFLSRQVAFADNIEGDIDTLSHRIAHIRSWTYVSNRSDWLDDPSYWQERTRTVEDKLSDALHDRLTQRFVNRTTSILMKRLRENAMIEAEISQTGNVLVEGHSIGQLQGFRFTALEGSGLGVNGAENALDARAVRAAAQKALTPEYEARANRLAICPNGDLAVGSDGVVRWLGAPLASLAPTHEFLRPKPVLLVDEQLTGTARGKVARRIERFVAYYFESSLKPLFDLTKALEKPSAESCSVAEDRKEKAAAPVALSGTGRGLAYQLVEKNGWLVRRHVADDVKALNSGERTMLRGIGVRFGTYHIFMPTLLKPVPAQALALLWALQHDACDRAGYGDVVAGLAAGRTSFVVDAAFHPHFYRLAGYRILGRRAVRLDSLEKLAELIRQTLAWREGAKDPRPAGFYDARQFLVSPNMLSSLGVSHGDMEEILKELGYRYHRMTAARVEEKRAAEKSAGMQGSVIGERFQEKAVALPLPEFVGPIFAMAEVMAKVMSAAENVPSAEPVKITPSAEKRTDRDKQGEGGEPEKEILLWHYHHRREGSRSRFAFKEGNQARTNGEFRDPATPFGKKQEQAGTEAQRQGKWRKGRREKKSKQGERGALPANPSRLRNNRTGDKRPSGPIDPDSPFAKLAALRDQLKR